MLRVPRRPALYILAAMAAAVIGLVAVAAAGNAGSADDVNVPPNRIVTYDDQLVAIAEDVPGFGGFYADPDSGALVVWLTDPEQRAVAEAKIADAFGPKRITAAGTRARLAQYGFDELKAWQRALDEKVWKIPGVVMTDVADEVNRVRIGVESEAARLAVLDEVEASGVPPDAVVLRFTQAVRPASSLDDKRRPTEGGLLISRTGESCTLGFVTSRSGTLGFVTNSHCTATVWGVDGGDWHQATTSDTPRIGVEMVDPGRFTGGSCPTGEECRGSDSAFVEFDDDSDGDQGEIARTNGSGSTTIDSSNPQFHVTAEATSYAVNDRLYKIGWITGWSSGLVTDACINVASNEDGTVLLCQGIVEADVGGGDSGSPVFERPDASSDVTLHGVLWGIQGNPTRFVFSPRGQVYEDLGAFETWDSCTSGC